MKRLLALTSLGLAIFVLVTVVIAWSGHRANSAQIAASDWVMVDADGPRLGARPVRQDISLVLFDLETAAELGHVRTDEADIRVYQTLFAAGARVVYDTRPVAAADDANFQQIQPLLDAMLQLRSGDRLMRDIYLGPDLLTSTHPQYTRLLARNLVNVNPHVVPSLRSRYYPMFHLTSIGIREAAPLRIAREVWGAEPPKSEAVGQQVRQSGVMTAWHQQAPEMVPEENAPRKPYPIAGRSINWYPFLSSTVLVPPAAFWVSYDPDIEAFRRFSFHDVLGGSGPLDVDGQIIIIGTSHQSDVAADSYQVPSLQRQAAPAEVVAAAVQTLLDERFMHEPPAAVQVLLVAILSVSLALLGGWLRPFAAALAVLGVLLGYFACAAWAYRSGWYSDFAIAPGAGLLSGALGFVYSSWLSVRSRQRVVDLFGRYVPRAVVSQLMLQPELRSLVLGGTKQDVTVMFADIRGFTTFSEDLPPEEVVRQLNSLLEIMVECTFEYEGTLDKFIGDAILVLFNAPLNQPDHVRRAVRTALSIQQRLAGHPTGLSVGIGLHRGEAVVGNIGAPRRLEYTAIGSTVNIASRLCGVAEPGEVIVSAAMVDDLGSEFTTEPLEPVNVKGIKKPLASFRVRQPTSAEAGPPTNAE